MDEPIEMDEVGIVNEGYDDDFNPNIEETEFSGDGGGEYNGGGEYGGDVRDNDSGFGDDYDINKSFTNKYVDS